MNKIVRVLSLFCSLETFLDPKWVVSPLFKFNLSIQNCVELWCLSTILNNLELSLIGLESIICIHNLIKIYPFTVCTIRFFESGRLGNRVRISFLTSNITLFTSQLNSQKRGHVDELMSMHPLWLFQCLLLHIIQFSHFHLLGLAYFCCIYTNISEWSSAEAIRGGLAWD